MALPSPRFVNKSLKPAVENKTHVQEVRKPATSHFSSYCKYCREGFPSENELFQHRKAHERCPYDGCKFNANAKVIADHVQRVHIQKGNALVKIQDLTTPEQIEKWREERRKRYPTTSNVLLRQQAQEERNQRGEKLQESKQRFGDFQQRNHIRNMDNRHPPRGDNKNSTRKRHYNNKERPTRPENEKTTKESSEVPEKVPRIETKTEERKPVVTPLPLKFPNDDSSDDDNIKTPRFKGTSQMKNYHKVETVVKERAALSILGMYGSESESEEVEEMEISEEKEVVVEVLPAKPSEQQESEEKLEESEEKLEEIEDEAPDEVPIEHSSELPEAPVENNSRKWKRDSLQARKDFKLKPRTVLDYSKLRKPSVNPFLEKLLQDDIRHERNLLLQCVNYVVKNNFFGVGQTMTMPEVVAVSKPEVGGK